MRSKILLGRFAIIVLITALAVFALLQYQKMPEPTPLAAAAQLQQGIGPTTGRVTMIDLGATECVPCKMMAPILAELKTEYAGRADIIFIDVWKDPAQGRKYRIRAIPTQIFFDADGKEVYRHTGFMDKQSIVQMLKRLGVS